jgi:hypothetical protein
MACFVGCCKPKPQQSKATSNDQAAQLTHFGTEQSPMMTGQFSNIFSSRAAKLCRVPPRSSASLPGSGAAAVQGCTRPGITMGARTRHKSASAHHSFAGTVRK